MSEQRSSEEKNADNKASDQSIRYVNLYETPDKIYTRRITGFFQNIRRYTGLPLIAAYLLLPWLVIDGRPAVLFDLPARKFHVLWMTFWPQDFMLLAWLLIISAFSLFTVTVLLGRVWCGFTCPQTVWTMMFMSVEHIVEGDRNKRIKLDRQGWTFEKISKKTVKHSLWILIGFITGATFIGYFVPIRELLAGLIPFRNDLGMLQIGVSPVAAFWTLFFTTMTYLNAGWMREQVCKYMCPYARFQSVMYDSDTLAVHYDPKRGERRGTRKPTDDYKAKGLGDCIDCSWCVQVCPVDIDIRDGLQYDCINCGLCVDACNAVMDKMKYPRGLIRFTSEDELKTGKTRFIRPRLFGYSFAVLAMISAFSYVLLSRTALSVDVIRDRGARLYRIAGDQVQNVYTIKINNMDDEPHEYSIELDGKYPFELRNYRPMRIEAGEVFTLPLRISIPRSELNTEKAKLKFIVTAQDDPELQAVETTNFIGPAVKKRR
ncbi:cytochrome c oxidase accessory protein CcoG [Teredinibacter sp. KSP-S5-2]|uniref:cytochrome c oxidase accessory protein CcoG n=1 Tax=Teredinibacter sp. KSP-S5-2 TaxID=3034506 RepID=UPI002934A613|nr:cytochrome c oxidase accessory protein CcoG [Teredinibacter sp. KSP-S5-2]WNO10202.1 cytochrome c oxidase accessory protein CcoG [Teredinibacter sp. KSP-S5-2]